MKIRTYRTKELSEPQAEQIQRKRYLATLQSNYWKVKMREKSGSQKKKYIHYTQRNKDTVLEHWDMQTPKNKKKSPYRSLMLCFDSHTPSLILLPFLNPGNNRFVLHFYNFGHFKNVILMKSCI